MAIKRTKRKVKKERKVSLGVRTKRGNIITKQVIAYQVGLDYFIEDYDLIRLLFKNDLDPSGSYPELKRYL